MKKHLLLTAAVALFSGATLASDAEVKWDNIGIGFASYDIEDVDEVSPTGVTIAGTKLFSESIFGIAQYSSVDDNIQGFEVGLDQLSIGFGYRAALSQRSDFYAAVTYEYMELNLAYQTYGESLDDSGFGVRVGTRTMLTPQFEVDVNLAYLSVDGEGETAFGLTGNYFITDNFSLGLGGAITNRINSFSANLRYSF